MANKNISGDVNVEFTEAQSRQSLESGESVKTLFGKLRKWLTDLKAVAFSGSYNDLSNKPSIPSTEVTETSDTTPYIYKTSEHDAVYDELVGGSVAWNQLVQNGNFESTSGWGGVQATISAANNTLTLVAVGSQAFTGIQRGITQILANHVIIASYDYDASSISNFRRTLIQLRTGSVYTAYGSKTENKGTNSFLFKHTSTPDAIQIIFNKNTNFTSTDTITVKNFYCVDLTQMFGTTIADYVYNLEQSTAGSGIAWLKSYGFFTKDYYAYNAGGLASVNTSGKKVVSETTEITYPIQSIDLRGLYKLNGNKLYTDGDIYSADGTVTRKYGYRDYQSGDESLANAITDGTHTIYKLSAPTTETASSYTSPQMVYRNGTEEYLDTRDMPVPVGGNRKYVDIPDWMVNEYFDDVRAETSTLKTISKLQQENEVLKNALSQSTFFIPEGTTTITESIITDRTKCFYYIPNSVTSIGEYAFWECTSLTSITIPNGVTSIGEYAFLGCTNLTSITISDSVTSIGEYAFKGCTSLTSIIIPNSVTSIGEWAFDECTSLTDITVNKPQGSISGAPWGAPNATVTWTG